MKPIVEYQDYHAFMSDYYEERKRTSAFSWREFAKIAGFTSPTYLKLVCEGKSNLSKVTMGRVARAMGLVGHEETYFEAMVQFGNARKDDQKKKYLEQMQSMALSHKVRVVDKDAFEYYETWKNPVVRELAPMMPGAMPGEIAKMCTQEVSALEVRKSLQLRCTVKWATWPLILWTVLRRTNATSLALPWALIAKPTKKLSKNSMPAAKKLWQSLRNVKTFRRFID